MTSSAPELGGRPMKFKSEKDLKDAIRGYFESCFELQWFDEPVRDEKTGEQMYDKKTKKLLFVPVRKSVQIKPFTVTGLAVWLDTTRNTILLYESGFYDDENSQFSHTIKKAKAIIEEKIEEKLHDSIRHTGLIFNLKNNFGWRDKLEIDHTTKDKEMNGVDSETQKQIKELNERLARQYEIERKKLL